MIEFLGDWKRSHYCGDLRASDIGSTVTLMGWAHRRRDHGGLIFVDLRDREGLAQIVFDPAVSSETHAKAESVRSEYVLAIKGKVIPRPAGTVNPNLKTGEVEIQVEECKLLNPSKTLPFTLDEHVDVAENIRLKYRYLDLRRTQLQDNIILRSKVAQTTRNYLSNNGFIEIETRSLQNPPLRARDFLFLQGLTRGSFMLSQSPQIFKQILMISGYDRYFQVVRCFAMRTLEGGSSAEFTQIDCEMSFIDRDDIISMMEGLIATIFRESKKLKFSSLFRG
jgi:aspartyl-tRNA synthetase